MESTYRISFDSRTAEARAEVKSSQNALLRIQGQCCDHIQYLTVQEDIHRSNRNTDGTEFLEQPYNDLITFIANVGAACGEVVKRLDGYDALEVEAFIAKHNRSE